jgi:hypothetical protein
MSSSDSDSEADAARKARLAFALWEPPKPIETPKVAPKAAPAKRTVIGFQQPDFREIPKSLDTIGGDDLDRETKSKKSEDVFGDSFVLAEQSLTTKVTRDEFYRRFKDLTVLGLRMSSKEREEHVLVQQKGARMLDKSLGEQIDFIEKSPSLESTSMPEEDDNGGIQMFYGAKTRITQVAAQVAPKIGLTGSTSRPAGWDIKRSTRVVSDDDSNSDSEQSRRRKVALAGVVVDFSSSSGFTAHSNSKPASVKELDHLSMDIDVPASDPSPEKKRLKKDKHKDKKDKHKKEKHKKHKQEKESSNSKKRKREGANSDNESSLR